MWTSIRKFFSEVPTPLSGLALGIGSLGLGLEKALPLHTLGQSIGAAAAFGLLLCIALKFILHPHLLQQDLRHPVVGSILPTFAMGLMLISKALGVWWPLAGEFLWLFAIGLHLVLMVCFIFYRLKLRDFRQMVPSWFVPFVGIILAAVTIPNEQHHFLAYVVLTAGMINYGVMLPVMCYRLLFSSELADAAKPTIAIMAAPASLSLAGYLTLESDPSLLLCSLLLGIAVLMTAVIYMAFFRLLRLPFSPAFAAYTFPLAVGATALYKVAERLSENTAMLEYARQFSIMAVVEMVIASLIVAYVCLRYCLHYGGVYVPIVRRDLQRQVLDS